MNGNTDKKLIESYIKGDLNPQEKKDFLKRAGSDRVFIKELTIAVKESEAAKKQSKRGNSKTTMIIRAIRKYRNRF